MKPFFKICLLLSISHQLTSQQQPDTLYANAHQVLSVFFDAPIEKAITGSDHFTFTFNQVKSENLGLLQGQKGRDSNLLVLTQNGGIYSFVIAYRDQLPSFIRFVKGASSKHKAPKTVAPTVTKTDIPTQVSKICQQMLRASLSQEKGRKHRSIRFAAAQRFYHEDLVYVRFELANHSAVNYEVEALTLFKVLGHPARKSSYQELPLTPSYAFELPKVIPQGTSTRFILVYPKFTLGAHESLKVTLRERDGSRNFHFTL